MELSPVKLQNYGFLATTSVALWQGAWGQGNIR